MTIATPDLGDNNEPERQTQLERDTEALFDYAAATPSFTHDDVEAALDMPYHRFVAAVRQVRLLFQTDTINLICEPRSKGERWLYRLVGTYDEQRVWAANRDGDMMARLDTMLAVANSLVNATDGRTLDGRRARLISSVLASLHTQLETMEASL